VRVRPAVVFSFLRLMKQVNRLYSDVEIDESDATAQQLNDLSDNLLQKALVESSPDVLRLAKSAGSSVAHAETDPTRTEPLVSEMKAAANMAEADDINLPETFNDFLDDIDQLYANAAHDIVEEENKQLSEHQKQTANNAQSDSHESDDDWVDLNDDKLHLGAEERYVDLQDTEDDSNENGDENDSDMSDAEENNAEEDNKVSFGSPGRYVRKSDADLPSDTEEHVMGTDKLVDTSMTVGELHNITLLEKTGVSERTPGGARV